MQDPTHRYHFYRGDTLLGTVVHTADDQPFHIGHIELAAGFAEVAPLFEEAERLRQSPDIELQHKNRRLAEIHEEITKPGLRMIGESTGKLRFEPNIISVNGKNIRWRGYVWHEDQRF